MQRRDRHRRRPARGIATRVMLGTLAVAGLAVAVVGGELWYAASRDRLPSDPGFEVDVRAGDDLLGDELRVELLGDSTVRGVGADTARESLGGYLAEKLADRTGSPVRVVGRGVTGARTKDVLEEQLRKVEDGADAIVIEVGSNDATHATRLSLVESQTREMLELALERSDVVVLGSAGKLNTPNFHQPLRRLIMFRASQVRARQREVARDLGVPFVDVARDVSPAYDAAAPRSTSSDLFHPSPVGYEIWARPLARATAQALANERS